MQPDELARHAFRALAQGRLLLLTVGGPLPPGFPRGMLLFGTTRMFEPALILRWLRETR